MILTLDPAPTHTQATRFAQRTRTVPQQAVMSACSRRPFWAKERKGTKVSGPIGSPLSFSVPSLLRSSAFFISFSFPLFPAKKNNSFPHRHPRVFTFRHVCSSIPRLLKDCWCDPPQLASCIAHSTSLCTPYWSSYLCTLDLGPLRVPERLWKVCRDLEGADQEEQGAPGLC